MHMWGDDGPVLRPPADCWQQQKYSVQIMIKKTRAGKCKKDGPAGQPTSLSTIIFSHLVKNKCGMDVCGLPVLSERWSFAGYRKEEVIRGFVANGLMCWIEEKMQEISPSDLKLGCYQWLKSIELDGHIIVNLFAQMFPDWKHPWVNA